MSLRTGSSVVSSPSSPRALTPVLMENFNPIDAFSDYNYTLKNKKDVFESAEHTLKMLLAESERIKQLVNEAEHKSKHVLANSQNANVPNGESNLVKSPSYVDLYDEELIETNKMCYMQ